MRKEKFLDGLAKFAFAFAFVFFGLILIGLVYESTGRSLTDTVLIFITFFALVGGVWGFSRLLGE